LVEGSVAAAAVAVGEAEWAVVAADATNTRSVINKHWVVLQLPMNATRTAAKRCRPLVISCDASFAER
jgi:hypothetical protein